MPFPSEHAARQKEPDLFTRFRRTHPRGFPAGVDAILGVRDGADGETTVIQSLRFDAETWTPAAAKAWLVEHDFTISEFEQATGEEVIRARRPITVEYLEAVLEQARSLLTGSQWVEIHRRAFPSSGGKATSKRRREALRSAPVFHADPLAKVVYVAVMIPGEKDSFGTVLTPEVIRRAAHEFADVREIVIDHRVHPDAWPKGVDAKVASTVEGGTVIEQAYFDARVWDQARATAFLDDNGIEKGVLEQEPPIEPQLVETAIAPVTLTEMHGRKLAQPLPVGSWYIGAHHPSWTAEDMAAFTGASVGAFFD